MHLRNINILILSRIYLVCIFLLANHFLLGQEEMLFDTPVKTYTFGSEDGFKGKFIRKILKDREGFIWIACSDGIYRFDGKNFRSYYYDPEANLSFKQGEYNNIFEDSKGRIWLSGFDGGVCYIDKKENKTTLFSHSSSDSSSIASLHTGSIFEDSKGVIWVCSNNYVLHRFNEDSMDFTRYTIDIPSHFLNYENEFSYFGEIIEDSQDENILWVGSRFGLLRFHKIKEESTLFPLRKEHIKWYRYGYTPIPIFQSDDSVWLGSSADQGIFIFDKKSKDFREQLILDKVDEQSYSNKIRKLISFNDSTVLALSVNSIWKVDKTTLKAKKVKTDGKEGLNYLSDMLYDEENIWIAGDQKLQLLTRQEFPIINHELINYNPTINKPNAIISVLESQDKHSIFFGTLNGDGIWKYDKASKELTPSRLNSSNKPTEIDFDFNDMTYDPYGKLWIAASYQLGSFDQEEKTILVEPTYPKLGDLIKDPITYRIVADSNFVWLALYENGIVRMDMETHKLIPFENSNEHILLAGKRISAIEPDDSGRMWIGTNEGLKYFDISKNKLISPELISEFLDLAHIKINDIEYSDGKLYLGTFGHGLIVVETETLKAEIKKNPYPLANLIYKVAVGENEVWTSSQYGLSSYSYENERFKNFSNVDISANPFIEFEIKYTSDGTVFFGNEWQFLSFEPEALQGFGSKPKAYIDELASQNSDQKYWVNTQNTTEMIFKAEDKDFTIKLGAINYNPLSNNQYTYRLSGYDEKWYTVLDEQQISYTNLRPGDYRFEYYAKDQYSDENAKLDYLDITIESKFYETIWFKLLLFLLLAAAVFWISNLREQKKRKKNQSKLALDYISSATFASYSSKKIANEIVQKLSAIFNFRSCEIHLFNEDTRQLELIAESKIDDALGIKSDQSSKEGSFQKINSSPNMHLGYVAPMKHKSKPSGALSVVHEKKNFFKDGVAESLDEIANIIAFKLEEADTQRKIELKDQELLELQQMRIKAELSALRAQMNPHFLFNTLNSINWFIIKNKPVEASRYLTKFSKLVRTILDNSKAPLISLDKELESLELYIDLESIRFAKKFESEIKLGKSINLRSLLIPPLIFQPFVENAIWHGLMHKKEPGKLLISIHKVNDILECSIEDNGVGRDFILKEKKSMKAGHKSEGIKITRDRILILDPSLSNPLLIHDLKNEQGEGIGTKVVLNLPLIFASDGGKPSSK